MTSPPELTRLVRALDGRRTGIGHDDVAWAFESSKTIPSITSWVQEYLTPATLLTREELTFSEKRDTSGVSNITSGPSISDEDFEAAISSLEASTASIEKQCNLLEAQKKALQEIQARNASSSTESTRAQRPNKFTRERAAAEFEASELASSLQTRIQQSLKQSECATDGIQSTVERLLEKDDRLLDGLQKVLLQLSDVTTGSGSSGEVDSLCKALIAYSSAEINARIDAAFKSAAQSNGHQANGHANGTRTSSTTSSQGESLRAELEELCREIDGLSTMAVDNQYRNPILQALEAAKSESDDDRAQWMQYMRDALQHLIGRLESMEDGALQLRSQNSALRTVSTALDSILAMKIERKPSFQALSQSPSKASQKGLKPLRLVQANLSESQDPAAQLLRHLDVQVADSRDSAQLAESLSTAVKDKTDKLSALSTRTETAITDHISRSIAKADANVQALRSGVYSYSPYETVNLVSNEITEGIDELEQKTQSLGDEMRQLDLDKMSNMVREKQREILN